MRDRFPFKMVSGVPVVTAPEEIDVISAPELRAALLWAAGHGHGTLVVDMTQTRFCDSSGLHTVLAAHRRAQAEGGQLLLVALPGTTVLRVLALTGIDRIIANFTTLDDALAHASANGSNGRRGTHDGPEGGPAKPAGGATRPATRPRQPSDP
jgi:anti-sigma B factor antagonist